MRTTTKRDSERVRQLVEKAVKRGRFGSLARSVLAHEFSQRREGLIVCADANESDNKGSITASGRVNDVCHCLVAWHDEDVFVLPLGFGMEQLADLAGVKGSVVWALKGLLNVKNLNRAQVVQAEASDAPKYALRLLAALERVAAPVPDRLGVLKCHVKNFERDGLEALGRDRNIPEQYRTLRKILLKLARKEISRGSIAFDDFFLRGDADFMIDLIPSALADSSIGFTLYRTWDSDFEREWVNVGVWTNNKTWTSRKRKFSSLQLLADFTERLIRNVTSYNRSGNPGQRNTINTLWMLNIDNLVLALASIARNSEKLTLSGRDDLVGAALALREALDAAYASSEENRQCASLAKRYLLGRDKEVDTINTVIGSIVL